MDNVVVGAVVVGIMTIISGIVLSWINKRRSREQHTWQIEVGELGEIKKRAGQLVELITSYQHSLDWIEEHSHDDLQWLESEAGRLRRHPNIRQAIKDLKNDLDSIIDDRRQGDDFRLLKKDAILNYERLLKECDKVTGKRAV